jgi:capsule polysaccharide export protein KpsE/RkpR
MIIRNTMIVAVVVAGISLLFSNWYKGTAVILPPSNDAFNLGGMGIVGSMGLGNLIGGATEDQNKILAILNSNSILEALAKKYDFINRYEVDNMEEAIKALGSNFDVTLKEEMQIAVSFWDKDQDRVAEMTNYIIYALDSLNLALNTKKGRDNRIFIESRINEVIDSLQLLQTKVVKFMKEEGVLSLPEQVKVGVQTAATFKAEIMKKQIELAIAQNSFDDDSHIVIKLKKEIEILQEKYKEFFTEDPEDKLMPNFKKTPQVGIRFTQLEKEIEYYFKIIEFLGPLYEKAKIDEMKNVPTIQILDKAVRPEKKDRPSRSKFVLISFMLTFIISSYYAYLKDRSQYVNKSATT